MSKVTVKPSKKFLLLVHDVYGGPHAAAEALGIVPTTLIRFLDGDTVLSGTTVAALIERTKLSYNDLFEHTATKETK